MRTFSIIFSIVLTANATLLLDIEAKRRAAIAAKDFATLESIYAADFRGIVGNGAIADRAFLFNIFRNDDPTLKFETDELLVREFGDAAIVTGRLTATRDGALASQQRFSHYFVQRDGRWQLVAAQGTPVH